MDILIVDDSWTVRVKFKKFLSDKGFIVHEAENALEAIDSLRCYKSIKLVISDLNMPGMDGMTFIALAKKEAQRLGVSAWVAKPLN